MPRPKRIISAEEEANIIRAYSRGETTPAIYKKFDLSPVALYKILDANAVPRRGNSLAPDILRAILTDYLRNPECSLQELAGKHNISRTALYKILSRHENPRNPDIEALNPWWYKVLQRLQPNVGWTERLNALPSHEEAKTLLALRGAILNRRNQKVVDLYQIERTNEQANMPLLEDGTKNPRFDPTLAVLSKNIKLSEIATITGIAATAIPAILERHGVTRDRSEKVTKGSEISRVEQRIANLQKKLAKLRAAVALDPTTYKLETPEPVHLPPAKVVPLNVPETTVTENATQPTPTDISSWF